MKTLLRIDASIRPTGSVSRIMGDDFVSCWKQKHTVGRIRSRDLQLDPVPHLSQSVVDTFFMGLPNNDKQTLSDRLIEELVLSDEILITCPMYNFQVPSTLKAYFDHVLRANKTFQYKEGNYFGMLKNKRSYVLTVMGGRKSDVMQEEAFESYIRTILGVMGIHDTTIYCVDGTADHEYVIPQLSVFKTKIENII